MKKLFIDQNTVLSFCHDDVLEDGSTFKEHLYNHQSLEHLEYNGETQEFDLSQFDENGDGQLDEADRVRLIDAITKKPEDQKASVETKPEVEEKKHQRVDRRPRNGSNKRGCSWKRENWYHKKRHRSLLRR